MKEIIMEKKYNKKVEFYTLVTRFDEYQEMVNSAKNAGFDRDDIDFYYFDNKKSNEFDGYSGINHALNISNAEYLVFCHQDILFKYDGYEKLIKCINELNTLDNNWAIAGNAGANEFGKVYIKIIDPNGSHNQGPFPQKVHCLDENFIIINMKKNVACSSNLGGFHLYGLDLCQNADALGLNSYVIDFLLEHKSAGNVDYRFYESLNNYIKIQKRRKSTRLYTTLCATKVISSNSILNVFLNLRVIRKLYIYVLQLKKS